MQVVGDLIGVHASTACRTTLRVTNALYSKITDWIKMPDQLHADQQKLKFYGMRGFPSELLHIEVMPPKICDKCVGFFQ